MYTPPNRRPAARPQDRATRPFPVPPARDSWNEPPPPPTDPWARPIPPMAAPRRMRSRRRSCSCLPLLLPFGLIFVCLTVFLLLPFRTNVLLLGIDYTARNGFAGRSDTIILTTFRPLTPYIGMLSIPRDLWVTIPGYGENRINTAHFFAESQQAGQGPGAAMDTLQQNFGVDVHYYVRIRFEGFRDVIDALGGVDIDLAEPTAGYEAGRHHLTGSKALAFVRHRAGSDDFFRMEHGQLLLRAVMRQSLNPLKWWRFPAGALALGRAIDTNLPPWMWPRLGLALLRLGPGGIDSRTITREMTSPYVTSEGADVLLPNWPAINPLLLDMFGQ